MDAHLEYVDWLHKLFPPQGRWRESDYFMLPDSNQIIKLSDGSITMTHPPTPEHQRVVWRLTRALDDFVAEHDLGEVMLAPVAVRLW